MRIDGGKDDILFFIALLQELIKISGYPVQWVEAIDEVKIVGGVDISSSKTNSQFAVVSLVLYSFPQLEVGYLLLWLYYVCISASCNT